MAALMPFPSVQHLSSGNAFFDNQPSPMDSHYDSQPLKSYYNRPAQRIRNPPSPPLTRGALRHSSVVKNLRGGAKRLRQLSRTQARPRGGKGKRRKPERSNFSLSSLLPSLASLVFGRETFKEEVGERIEEGNAGRRAEDLMGSQSKTYDEKPQVSIWRWWLVECWGIDFLCFFPHLVPSAKVVFFPTGETEAGGCQDAATGGGIIVLKGEKMLFIRPRDVGALRHVTCVVREASESLAKAPQYLTQSCIRYFEITRRATILCQLKKANVQCHIIYKGFFIPCWTNLCYQAASTHLASSPFWWPASMQWAW